MNKMLLKIVALLSVRNDDADELNLCTGSAQACLSITLLQLELYY